MSLNLNPQINQFYGNQFFQALHMNWVLDEMVGNATYNNNAPPYIGNDDF